MLKVILCTLIILCSLNISYGAKVLDKGMITPYKGVLFTMEEEKELRATKEKVIRLEDLAVVLNEKSRVQDLRIKNLKEYAEENVPLNGWQKAGYFLLGVLSTSALMYGSVRIMESWKR